MKSDDPRLENARKEMEQRIAKYDERMLTVIKNHLGFRDDYRQSIASGLIAANNRSYHGGSLRGGYGHGLAADVLSIRGAMRAERLGSSQILWKWIDDHGKEFGIGRPYQDRDPPHVAPVDGEEYARHRPEMKSRQAAAKTN
jgi:hypothetical protein